MDQLPFNKNELAKIYYFLIDSKLNYEYQKIPYWTIVNHLLPKTYTQYLQTLKDYNIIEYEYNNDTCSNVYKFHKDFDINCLNSPEIIQIVDNYKQYLYNKNTQNLNYNLYTTEIPKPKPTFKYNYIPNKDSGCVYKIVNLINNKMYIGQTKNFTKRIQCHKSSYINNDTFLYNAINKYGWDNFEVSIVEDNIPNSHLRSRETYYIDMLDTYRNGYNSSNNKLLNNDYHIDNRINKLLKVLNKLNLEFTYKHDIFYVNDIISKEKIENIYVKLQGDITDIIVKSL